jgi:hypothetical protein
MREINKIAEGLFEKIRDRFEDVSLGNENADATQNPEDARFFNFDYIVNGKKYGNVTLSIVDEVSLKVYFSKNISNDLDDEERQTWYKFLKELREFAKRNLLSFEPRDITRNTLKHRDIKQVSKADSTVDKDEVIGESRLYGTSRSSYENDGPVKIIIRHSDHVDSEKRGDRSRKIRAIYLENADGERLKLPHNSLRYARAMARHCAEGGSISDEFGQHITEIAEECNKLKPFKAAMVRRVFEDEETQRMVEAAFEYHGLLKDTLNKMSGRKGYARCKESFQANEETLMDDFDADNMRERFVRKTYNDKMEDALPLVQKAYKMKKQNKFAEQFESWANTVSEEWDDSDDAQQWGAEPINIDELADLMSDPIPFGVDAINATAAIEGVIIDDNLISEMELAAKEDPTADARDFILFWLENNEPAVYQELMNEIGDADTADQYGASDGGMDGQVSEGYDDGMSAEELYNTIHRRIMHGLKQGEHADLLKKLGPDGLMDAMKDEAEFHVGANEWGSSDTSGIIRSIYRNAGLEFPEVSEDFGAYSPSDSASPLTHAQEEYCDACDSTECHCDDQLEEGRMKEVATDIEELSNKQFYAKYKMSKDAMKAKLAENVGDDHVNKDVKMKRMGAKELSTLDKLKMMPRQMKAFAKGDSEDDLVNYNKQFNEEIAQMRRIAGLK